MSNALKNARRGKRRASINTPNDVLCYADQGSFLGLRALGRGPIVHLTWLYSAQPPDEEIEHFNNRLAEGRLARLLQRSVLPWGRHRWVAQQAAIPISWFRAGIPRAQLADWRESLIHLSLDPEHGPGWRLAVQAFEDGGCAISLLVSHTIADGEAAIMAVAEAVSGEQGRCMFPAAPSGWLPTRLGRDLIESLRSLTEFLGAIGKLLRNRPTIAVPPAHHPVRLADPTASDDQAVVAVPLVQVNLRIPTSQSSSTKRSPSPSIVALNFAARLAERMGRVDTSGHVSIILPVSDRKPGDCRGNALRPIRLTIDLRRELDDPLHLHARLRAALSSLLRHGDEMSSLFPLIPYVPRWLARHLEQTALGSDRPTGCSLLGELPEAFYRPAGPASHVIISTLERFTRSDLAHLQGQLFMVGHISGEHYILSVAGYAPQRITSRSQLDQAVREVLAETGLAGSIL